MTNQKSLIEFWDVQLRRIWDEGYAEKLSDYLRSLDVKTILDCAGGSGYPAIEFKKMNWDISYSDGVEGTVDFFKKKMIGAEVDIPCFYSKWEDLDGNRPETYDAVLCRGNSFISINSYIDEVLDPPSFEESYDNMKKAVKAFHNSLSPGGVLYIDIPVKEVAKPEKPYSRVDTDNKTFEDKISGSYDPLTKIRELVIDSHNLITGEKVYYKTYQYPISKEELYKLLDEAGFSKVLQSPVDEPQYMDAFVAFK
ncbi:class I SAM-dependent methyltransferase [Leucothrix arctica]|uniref:Methyltransferase domain-containing protein n=1 Tax=Leucothrix arctica TaxID=1481894 RepID=A0A317C641_9GAMM|nr:class I SAM-dependent methyltransferase [Leucothrix arctica]PWQ93739.1 hypothetical protein DKT75_19205 [Leucothrix arctica]